MFVEVEDKLCSVYAHNAIFPSDISQTERDTHI